MAKFLRLALFAIAALAVVGGIAFLAALIVCKPRVQQLFLTEASYRKHLCEGSTPSAPRILFVGDSFTYLHMLPWAVAFFAENNQKVRPDVYQLVAPNWTLDQHCKEGEFQTILKDNKINYVVLQENQKRVLTKPDKMFDSAGKLAQIATNFGARVVIFEVWADKQRVDDQKEISEVTDRMARLLFAKNAAVGDAFFKLDHKTAKISLYSDDTHSSSDQGAYLAACVLYETIFDTSCKGVPWTVTYQLPIGPVQMISVTPEEAAQLQQIAASTKAVVAAPPAKVKRISKRRR